MEALRPNSKRAQTAIFFFYITLSLELLSAASGYLQYLLLQDVQNGVDVSEDRAALNDLREAIIALLSLAVYITGIVMFLLWFRRAFFNLRQRANYLNYTDAEAVYSWFIPILSFYRPFQIMREVYNETKYLFEKNSISLTRPLSSDFLGIWWALWIINNITGQIAFRVSLKAETIDELIFSTRAGMAANAMGVFAALAVIKVVNDYSKIEPMIAQVPDPVPA